ncbi:MAG: hypothetical protein GF317_07360 [Candidatus Lokiarchaeota archaeon]|nr:hypothetical protein [Candidatus Lokiarchaeota archaeon]MBD3199526.1 hypothetical protein [Candidatus Lokiarchaeota archaeon]
MFTNKNIERIQKNKPIFIKPNIGQPILLNLQEEIESNGKSSNNIDFDLFGLYVSKIDINEVMKNLEDNVYLQPVLAGKGEFNERRGKLIKLSILKVSKVLSPNLKKKVYPTENSCEIWDIYHNIRKGGFKKSRRDTLFKCEVSFRVPNDLADLIDEFNVILFDLIVYFNNHKQKRVNYHSIALFNKSWENFRFIHATDTHIARRNDFIYKFLKKEKNKKKNDNQLGTEDLNHEVLEYDFEFEEEFQHENLEIFRHGKFNFNYNLRLFISKVNKLCSNGKLDFIVLTGDIVDFVDTANTDEYYDNNFQFFLDILLGIQRELKVEIPEHINKEELLVPIFTIVGNHDYRKGYYSIKTGIIYKKFGLEKKDVKNYKDDKYFNYFRSMYSRTKFLEDYFKFINPNRNFKIDIGKDYSLIFLDTGIDSIANLFGLMRSAPSTRGLKDYQIESLRNYIIQSQNRNVIVFMHTPPLSPNLGPWKKWRLRKRFGLKRKVEWYDFYEQNIEKYTGSKRIDSILYFKYQTIMYNWDILMEILSGSDKIIRRKIDLVFCGHTHTLKEFRIREAKEAEKQKVNLGFYFIPFYLKGPCKIYTNRYRDIIKKFDNILDLKSWFDAKKPFIFQTQGLGPLSSKFKVKSPGFRLVTIKKNQVVNIAVYSMQIKSKE